MLRAADDRGGCDDDERTVVRRALSVPVCIGFRFVSRYVCVGVMRVEATTTLNATFCTTLSHATELQGFKSTYMFAKTKSTFPQIPL